MRVQKQINGARYFVDRYVKRPAIEFYDMQKDPWELNNLAEEKEVCENVLL